MCAVFIVRQSLGTIPRNKNLPSYAWWNLHWSQSSASYVHDSRKSQLYTYLDREGHWALPSSVRSVYNSRKTSYPPIRLAKAHLLRFPGIAIPRKTSYSLYNYLAYDSSPCVFMACDSAHNSKKTSYALT